MPLIRRRDGSGPTPVPCAPDIALRDGSVEERWAAARALASDPANLTALGQALGTETDPAVREAILTGLARIGGAASVGFILPGLRADMPAMRTAAMDALQAMIDDVRPELPRLLADPDPDIRILSCELARGLHAPDATPLMCALLLHEPEINVCAAAVDVLAEVGDSSAIPALRACAARFPANAFLSFAVRIALERLSAGHG